MSELEPRGARRPAPVTSRYFGGDGTFYFYNHTTGSLFVDDVVLTYANVPYTELANVAPIQGANMVTTAGGFALADLFNTDRDPYPDHAYDLGLDVVPNLTETARLQAPEVFPSIMETFAPHLANVAFYLADEPDQAYYQYSLIDPAKMQAEVAAAHTKSALPLLADLQHAHYDVPSVDQPYQNSEDIYGSEPYQEDTSGITQTFKVFATMTKRPVWLFDDNHTDVSTVVPKAWYGTILGATGLAYFDWASLDAASRTADAQAIGEIAQLADAIFATDATSAVTAPASISYAARSLGGKTYVFAVNPAATNVQATFVVRNFVFVIFGTMAASFDCGARTGCRLYFTASFRTDGGGTWTEIWVATR